MLLYQRSKEIDTVLHILCVALKLKYDTYTSELAESREKLDF